MKIKITDSDSLYFGEIFLTYEQIGDIVSVLGNGGAKIWFHSSEFEII